MIKIRFWGRIIIFSYLIYRRNTRNSYRIVTRNVSVTILFVRITFAHLAHTFGGLLPPHEQFTAVLIPVIDQQRAGIVIVVQEAGPAFCAAVQRRKPKLSR